MDAAARRALAALLTIAAVLLPGCASRQPAAGRDGPPAEVPPGLERTPDAVPRVEPLRVGGPNKPYEVFGDSWTPVTTDRPMRDVGGASWYGRKFHGQPTASGEPYDMFAMTAAHKTMPIPSYARVRNPANGSQVVVRINDRGPFAPGRVIDLSYTAALRLGVLSGVATVQVERLTHADIRAGAWRDPAGAATAALPAVPEPQPAPTMADATAAAPAAGFWLQLGAFRQRELAAQLQQRLQRDAAGVATWLFDERALYRVQAGPFASRAEALGVAERLRALLELTPLLLERR